jgi:hypothetical protein
MRHRRYYVHGREVARREALNDWLRAAASVGWIKLAARRTFETAEDFARAKPGELAQAQRDIATAGVVITGVEGQ